jgi:hypothetical protein
LTSPIQRPPATPLKTAAATSNRAKTPADVVGGVHEANTAEAEHDAHAAELADAEDAPLIGTSSRTVVRSRSGTSSRGNAEKIAIYCPAPSSGDRAAKTAARAPRRRYAADEYAC